MTTSSSSCAAPELTLTQCRDALRATQALLVGARSKHMRRKYEQLERTWAGRVAELERASYVMAEPQ